MWMWHDGLLLLSATRTACCCIFIMCTSALKEAVHAEG